MKDRHLVVTKEGSLQGVLRAVIATPHPVGMIWNYTASKGTEPLDYYLKNAHNGY